MSIFEFGYRYLIPSIKRRLAEKLIEMGLTYREAAKRIGLSPSAISRYISGERGVYIVLHSDLDRAISELATLIINNRIDFNEVQVQIHRIAIYALSRKYVCEDHAKIDLKVNPKLCSICPTLFSSSS
ncbi:MAG: helix-turn-helix domain-containing protein [Candidatus Methanomethyliaceae archaeon]|nr:helix-turn-helix domain-containing protein [Candidatus Methanomethyliaceae archaeon]